jgi:hypothetical protein
VIVRYISVDVIFVRFLFSGGKRDEDLILPINDSLSVTLSSEQVQMKFLLASL